MSAAQQTVELLARLKAERRVITDRAHIAEISARINAHAPHLKTEWESHQSSQHAASK